MLKIALVYEKSNMVDSLIILFSDIFINRKNSRSFSSTISRLIDLI